MSPNEPLWSAQNLSDYLNVPIMTIYYWRTIDYGPQGTKVGRHLRYRPDDVRRWFETQTREVS